MAKALVLAFLFALAASPAFSQATIVATCGGSNYQPVGTAFPTMDITGKLCVSGAGGGGGAVTAAPGSYSVGYSADLGNGSTATAWNGVGSPGSLIAATMALYNQSVGATNLATGQATVTTAATLIGPLGGRTGPPGTGRVAITIINNTGSDRLCIANSNTVSITTGQCLPAVAGASITLNTTSVIYGIVPATTQTVSFSETY
jgi:hypothetical protein